MHSYQLPQTFSKLDNREGAALAVGKSPETKYHTINDDMVLLASKSIGLVLASENGNTICSLNVI